MIHQYKMFNQNIVLDICSGSIHVVDEIAYDMIAGFLDKDKNALVVEESHNTYGETGFFAVNYSVSAAGEYYLENSNTRLSWKKLGSSHYMDKY